MNNEKTARKDDLGDRMKKYEEVTRYHLLPRSYVFCRIDGRSFHSYLRGCKRPFDADVIADMNATAVYLCENVQNAKLGYVQSDEITLLLCDFDTYDTSQFFDGNIQKISSVVASMAAAKFNQCRAQRFIEKKSMNLLGGEFPLASFDCRCWVVPNRWEAANVFIWRNQDCSRNSVSMVAQANFSHKELQGVSIAGMHEMLHEKGINWATAFSDGEKNGRLIVKENYLSELTLPRNTDGKIHVDAIITHEGVGAMRSRWVSKGAWKFTDDKDKLLNMIPKYE